ncbi:MAG: hypothetical protein ACI38Y_02475 [Candidatus Methanomethylophilaceae archaeon]
MDKKMIAVVGVIAVVIVAAAAFVVLKDDGGSGSDKLADSYPTNLMIMGNANLDDYLDQKDVTYIQNLLSKGDVDYSKYYMADANGDGKITEDDVTYLKKMLAEEWDEIKYVYYLNANLKMAKFDMSVDDRMLITLICPPLDNVLILNPDLLYGTDMRPDTGKYKPQYEGLLAQLEKDNGRELVNVGIAATPTLELISQASKDNGGHMIVLCGDDSYGPNMEESLAGSGVQVLRLPTWEYGGTMPGLLTLAYILDVDDSDGVKEMERAYEFQAWYDDIENHVKQAVAKVPESERPNVSTVYAYTDPLQILGTYTGEYNNSLKLGIGDVTKEYMHGAATGGHGNAIDNEVISQLVKNYDLDILVGLVGTPFQIEDNDAKGSSGVDQASYNGMKNLYDKWMAIIGPALGGDNGADFFLSGYSFLSGASEPLGQIILGYYFYSDVISDFNLDYLEQKVNEYCQWLGIYDIDGDGVSTQYGEDGRPYEWCFDCMNLLYAGEDNPKNIMNRLN